MSLIGALLDALDGGLVVFKTDAGLVVAGHPLGDFLQPGPHLLQVEMVWDLDDVADARKLA